MGLVGPRFLEEVLVDAERNVCVESWRVSEEEVSLGERGPWHIEKRRLHGGRSEGVDVVEVDNGRLSFTVVPTRGMGIWRGSFDGCALGWDSPVGGPVHPCYVNLEARGGLGWLEGFSEWVVRCGLESFGAPGEDTILDNQGNPRTVRLTLHGRIANTPASEVRARVGQEDPFELGVCGTVYERSMFGPNLRLSTSITTALGSNRLKISDTVQNLRAVPNEMQLLYHCNYGRPFLEEGSRLVAPVRRVAPRDERAAEGVGELAVFGPPQPGFVEQVYFFELLGDEEGRTRVMLVNRDGTRATSLSFSLRQLPCFTLWKNTASLEDGYVVGLEPATNFPNRKGFERQAGRIVPLRPGEERAAGVTLAVHLGKSDVQRVEGDIRGLQGDMEPEVLRRPIPAFSPI